MKNTLKVKEAFFLLFCFLLENIQDYFSDEEGDDYKKSKMEEYIKDLEETRRAFMNELAKTQMFLNFIDKLCKSKYNKENDVTYFIKCLEKLKTLGNDNFITYINETSTRIFFNFKNVTQNINITLI